MSEIPESVVVGEESPSDQQQNHVEAPAAEKDSPTPPKKKKSVKKHQGDAAVTDGSTDETGKVESPAAGFDSHPKSPKKKKSIKKHKNDNVVVTEGATDDAGAVEAPPAGFDSPKSPKKKKSVKKHRDSTVATETVSDGTVDVEAPVGDDNPPMSPKKRKSHKKDKDKHIDGDSDNEKDKDKKHHKKKGHHNHDRESKKSLADPPEKTEPKEHELLNGTSPRKSCMVRSSVYDIEASAFMSTAEFHHGYADPFKVRKGRDLVWKNVNMTLNATGKNPDKKLLDDVWGEVPRGQVTAIMGPSGSGKTSLLNVLAGRTTTNHLITVETDVRLNNYKVDPGNIEVRKRIAFVAQDDSLQITSTPREAIRFSAKMRLPKTTTDEELDHLTTRVLAELGLENCADTYIGGALLKGVSGGERKRASVGVELVTRPALVFLDEPTSGLDSFNAVKLCHVLRKVANAGSSVLFTIHQPSSEIFNAFDRLILLNAGRVMYQGSISDVPDYFKSRGFPNPPNYNPADWIMNVALSNPMEILDEAGFFPADNRDIGEAFESDGDGKDPLGITDRSPVKDVSPPGIGTQIKELCQREVKNFIRNTHALKARTGMSVMISLMSGFIFFQIADTDYTEFINVQSTFGALLMSLMANVFSTALPSLTAFPEERPVFLREYSTNHYSAVSYFVSRLAMELIVSAVQVTVSTMLTYLLCGFTASYGIFWAGVYLMACSSTALGVFLGCAVENPSVAIEFLPAVFMPQILFAGFFVPPDLIPKWLSWISYICPLTYGVRIVTAAEFEDACDGLVPNYCLKVLDNIGSDPADTWWYFLVLVLLFAFFRLLALITLKRKAEKFY